MIPLTGGVQDYRLYVTSVIPRRPEWAIYDISVIWPVVFVVWDLGGSGIVGRET